MLLPFASPFQLAKLRAAWRGWHRGEPFPSPTHTPSGTAKGGQPGCTHWKMAEQPRGFWAAGSNLSSFPRTLGWAEDQRPPLASAPVVLAACLPARKVLQALLCPASCAWPSPAAAGTKPPSTLQQPLTRPTHSPVHPNPTSHLIYP